MRVGGVLTLTKKGAYALFMSISEVFKEGLRWIITIGVLGLILASFFGVFDSNENLVKPCEGMSGDIWKECVDFYIYEKGWTYDEITKGILVKNP